MTTVHLARHGETPWHAENRYAGLTDLGLTDRGQAQARDLADWVTRSRPDRVVSSDLQRARLTANDAATALGLQAGVDQRWREVDFGRGEGMTRAEMSSAFPVELDAFLARPATSPLPGAESGVAAIERVLPTLAEEAVAGGTVLVVAHTTLLRLLLCAVLGIDPDRYRSVFPALHNTAITTIEVPDAPASVDDLRGTGALLALNLRIGAR